MNRRVWLVGAVLVVLAVALVVMTRDDDGRALGREPVPRVLVVSVPGVGWSDVERGLLPNLERFARDAAVADISTRIGRRNATATDAYLTISAGTRAVAPDIDVAVAVDPDDRYGGVPTADILERRLGESTFEGIAYLAVGAARDRNADSVYGADVGLLGQTLADAGVSRAVIANSDAIEGFLDEVRPPDGYYARSAATTLMDSRGIVPNGAVGRSLLADDDAAAFGTRLDLDVVMDTFDGVWSADRGVVVVEASDVSRAAAYRPLATPEQRRTLRDDALRHADEMLGRLLAEVDPSRDAVMVVSPVSPHASPALGLTALQSPEVHGGYLESPTTRRAGYVQLADVAPTILTLLGEEFPTEMEGRSFHVVRDTPDDRTEALIDASEAARFRDDFLPAVVTVIVVLLVILLGLTLLRRRLPDTVSSGLRPLAYAALGMVPGTFVAGQVDAVHASAAGHWLVIVGVAAVVAAGAVLLDRWRPRSGLLFAVAATGLLLVGDVLSGAVLQKNTVFGYSMAVAGRFTGLGNLAYTLLGATAIVTAALLHQRYGRRLLPSIVAMLGVVVLVDGLPMLGADVGGVMSLIPAFGVTVLVLAGRPVRIKDLVVLAAGAALVVLVFAFVDAARPAETHTHLARLADHVLEGRWTVLANILNRRWQASFGSLELAGWGTVIMALVVALVYAEVQIRGRRTIRGWLPGRDAVSAYPTEVRAAMAGVAVLGLAGLVSNDSSVAVPLTALIVAVPAYCAWTIDKAVTV